MMPGRARHLHHRSTPLGRTAARPYRSARLELIPLHCWNAISRDGRELGKAPADGRWTTRQYDHTETLERAQRERLNLGVRLPADVVVLDVDPRHFPDGTNSLDKLVADTGIDLSAAPHVLTGNLNTPGHHYYFRKPAGAVLLESIEGYAGLEFKSLGRQVVAAGSVHPTGGLYEWAADSPPLADMPDLPSNVLKMARRPERTAAPSSDAGELTPELLAKTLEQLDPCDFGKKQHERWKELMMACHYATDGEGRQEFIDWCMGDSEYADQDWIVGRRWDSLHVNRDQKITTATLRMYLQEVGGDIASPDPEDDFDVWEDDGTVEAESSRWRFLSIDEVERLRWRGCRRRSGWCKASWSKPASQRSTGRPNRASHSLQWTWRWPLRAAWTGTGAPSSAAASCTSRRKARQASASACAPGR